MQIKAFALLAISTLAAATSLYMSPVIADDYNASTNDQNMQAPADTQMPNSSMPSNNENGSNNNNSSTNNNNDAATPDTATGDDDY